MADEDSIFKCCTKCGCEKPTEQFGKQTKRRDGLNPWCKACKSASGKDYYLRNAERLKPIRRAWNDAHPEQIKAYSRRHQAKWQKSDPDGYKAYMSKYRTPERNREYARGDYYRNRDARMAATKLWRLKNMALVSAIAKQWRAANKERARALSRSYKARKKGAEGRHSGQDVKRIYRLQRGKCACCSRTLAGGYHVDHVMPLALGGSNWPSNLQLLCKACNLSKGAKHPLDFAKLIGRLI